MFERDSSPPVAGGGDPIRTPHWVKRTRRTATVKFGVHYRSVQIRKKRVNGIRADKPVTIQQPYEQGGQHSFLSSAATGQNP